MRSDRRKLPERLTHRVNLSSVLGTVSFLSMLAVPGAAEGGNYILALVLTAVFAGCAHLAVREDGSRK